MALSRLRAKGRKEGRSFSKLIHAYFTSPEYAALSPRAVKLLIDLYAQFRGANNGDLTASWTVLRNVGWTSKDQLAKAVRELLETGWIVETRKGSRGICSLYGVTFIGIDECGGKLDGIYPKGSLHLWKTGNRGLIAAYSLPRRAGQAAPRDGATFATEIATCPAARGNFDPKPSISCPA